ncbi:GbsR/MarR family transcriptional regulator [Alicyclobacillus fodiniaquatilis]|uniref:HTH-type transcriptional regulator n=1 Tax=Alicyclobacillus fodiniaquatilis TaxID=1661150 RepID=A0ABW4JL07_9BACL
MEDYQRLEQARRHFTQSQAETMEMYGLNRSMGMLYGAMVFRDEPMTLDEMCKETGMSKTSMSTGVRELARLKLVRKKFVAGVRKDLYEVERDQFRSFVEFFTQIWGRAVELNMKGISESERQICVLLEDAHLDADVRDKAHRDLHHLAEAKRYYTWLQQLTTVFERGETIVPFPNQDEEG